MNYHNITTDDMLNGSGLRICLWVSGCNHYCDECQNPQTWDPNSGIKFSSESLQELFNELDKDYIAGITFTGGDPLYEKNIPTIYKICKAIRNRYKDKKSIWLYTGYDFDVCVSMFYDIIHLCDVIVDGKYKKEQADINYPWAGSTNQRVIDVQKSLKSGEVVLWSEYKKE